MNLIIYALPCVNILKIIGVRCKLNLLLHTTNNLFCCWIIVFCCIAAYTQSDISGCQQDFLVDLRWNQSRTLYGIFQYNFIDFWEASRKLRDCSRKYPKMFQTDFIFRHQKIKFKPEYGQIMKKLFYCPALEIFSCLPLWKTVRLPGKKLQNATKLTQRDLQKVSLSTLCTFFAF